MSDVGVEDVNAHRSEAFIFVMRRALRVGRLFLETHDSALAVDFEHAEAAGGLGGIHLDDGDGDIGAGGDVLIEHLLVIHLVDVVAGKNEDEIGAFAADGINILVDGVGGALIPGLRDAHLRRQHLNEIPQSHKRRPAAPDVAIQAESLVLGEHENPAKAAINAVGQGDVDDPVDTAEGDGRLGAVSRERPQPFPLPSGENHRDSLLDIEHRQRSRRRLPAARSTRAP